MAGYGSSSVTFSIVTILILVLSCPRVQVTAEHNDDDNEASGGGDEGSVSHIIITKKYASLWTKSPLTSPRYSYNVKDDIESVRCTSYVDCAAAMPGIEVALLYDSDLPSAPNCTVLGYCTCGLERCVSHSREFLTGKLFSYCGPCGYVGAKCTKTRCTHKLAECRSGYCECIEDGTFYDMAYCYIPFGRDTLVNAMIGMTVVLMVCIALAYGYHKLRNRRLRRGSIYSERSSGPSRRESPPDDTPPSYDDVTEKLPSYQDALQMSGMGAGEHGVDNPVFEGDETPSPGYKTNVESTQKDTDDLSQTTASIPDKGNDHTNSPTPDCENADFQERPMLSDTEDSNNITAPVTREQQSLGTQPIELPLHTTLQTQQTDTTL